MWRLRRFFKKSRSQEDTIVSQLERKIVALEQRLDGKLIIDQEVLLTFLENLNSTGKETAPDVFVKHLQVDKIIIEKLDYANNFGQLGIKELTGKLNIGTNYEGDFTDLLSEKLNEKIGQNKKVNIRAKNETQKRQ